MINKNYPKYLVASAFLIFFLVSCGGKSPKPIRYGEDQCAHCRMTVSDMRFGTQLLTSKGRTYQFDDLQCMVAYVKSGSVAKEDVAAFYLPDYVNDNKMAAAEEMYLLKSESLKSPMRGDIAAFINQEDLEQVKAEHNGEVQTWDDLWK